MRNEKNPGYLLYIGDYTTQLYGDYFINHYKDPYQTTRIQWKVGPGFFRGSYDSSKSNLQIPYLEVRDT